MNKSELTAKLAKEMNIPFREAAPIIDTILETMTDALVKGEHIEIRGFGTFSVKDYEGYEGRNPKTGEVVNVKPKRLPVFRVGRKLWEIIDAGSK